MAEHRRQRRRWGGGSGHTHGDGGNCRGGRPGNLFVPCSASSPHLLSESLNTCRGGSHARRPPLSSFPPPTRTLPSFFSLIRFLFFPSLHPRSGLSPNPPLVKNVISVIITAQPLKLMLRVADTVAEIEVSGVVCYTLAPHFLHLHVLYHFKPFDLLSTTSMVEVTGGGDGVTTAGWLRKPEEVIVQMHLCLFIHRLNSKLDLHPGLLTDGVRRQRVEPDTLSVLFVAALFF